MSGRRRGAELLAVVLAVSLFSSAVTAILTAAHARRAQFQLLGEICRDVGQEQPEAARSVFAALKRYKETAGGQREQGRERERQPQQEGNILWDLGYRPSDFWNSSQRSPMYFAAAGFAVGALLLLAVLRRRRERLLRRVDALTDYLEKVNTGARGLVIPDEEDAFSRLQDAIYKTVTNLNQTRDQAIEAKEGFAENLANIAHQLKTPITAISLSAQMMDANSNANSNVNSREGRAGQIMRQLNRLTRLEEALLLLSRIDAGTLPLEQKPVDIFTVLTLAADNLQELFDQAGVTADVPEMGRAEIIGDTEWTMEAVMNLMKNCLEHTPPGGAVHCSYERNPLYVQIRIWDEGPGFAAEDLPRLFERFYRGQSAAAGGIGIGLALAKAIAELQNGVVTAFNLPEGGACFEIRFYCH